MSRREQILTAIQTALSPIPVERSRVIAVDRGSGIAVWISPVQDSANQVVHTRIDWELLIRIGVVARGAVPDQVADSTVSQIHSKMMADLTLGGIAYDVQPRSTSWQFVDADNGAAEVSCDFAILYRTGLQSIDGGS